MPNWPVSGIGYPEVCVCLSETTVTGALLGIPTVFLDPASAAAHLQANPTHILVPAVRGS